MRNNVCLVNENTLAQPSGVGHEIVVYGIALYNSFLLL